MFRVWGTAHDAATVAGGRTSEAKRIVDQLTRVFSGDAWYGPALCRLLDAFTPEQAAARPLPHRHSAWELVLHLTSNVNWVRQRLRGTTVELTQTEDWPVVPEVSATAWSSARAALEASHADLVRLVTGLTDTQLMQLVPGRDYPIHVMVHGIAQHNAYHAGQLALLLPAAPARPG